VWRARLIYVRAFFLLLVAAGWLSAQMPRIGVVDFYGIRKVPQERILKTAGIREGDPLPASKADIEDRIEKIPGVVLARLEAVCCAGERAVLYIGIEERDAPHFEFREPPGGTATLPADLVDAYRSFLRAFEEAARAGETGEDLTRGHALSKYPAARSCQEKFVTLADDNLAAIRKALRESQDPEQRAIAAYVIGYASTKRMVVDDLQYAMRDSDQSVRANAMRALGAIAVLAHQDSELGIRVQPTWVVEMLNSIVWSDRYRAAGALVGITESRDPDLLQELRERALLSLTGMARWKTLTHALPAFILVGRIAGLPDNQIYDAWNKGNRETVIKRATQKVALKSTE
jgi:hypothetical protein